MKEELKRFAASIGIDCIGIAPPGPYNDLAERLIARRENGHYTEFDEQDINKRIDPRLTMTDVQSVIVCLFPYYSGDKPDANLSKYCYGLDYHTVVKDKLTLIGNYLEERIPDFAYQAYTDTGPLADRYMAYLAGLGFYGINSHIITDKYGSYLFIGYLLVNYPFAPDHPLDRTCLRCGNCVKLCPGQIILGDFNINPRLCRSYLTQKKGELTAEEIAILQKTDLIFGCDVCQDVCPHNSNIAKTNIEEFKNNHIHRLNYEDIASMSNKEFANRYGNRAFSWRGKKLLLRNLEYLANKK